MINGTLFFPSYLSPQTWKELSPTYVIIQKHRAYLQIPEKVITLERKQMLKTSLDFLTSCRLQWRLLTSCKPPFFLCRLRSYLLPVRGPILHQICALWFIFSSSVYIMHDHRLPSNQSGHIPKWLTVLHPSNC